MVTTTIRQSILICAAVAVAVIGSLLALDAYGKANRVFHRAGSLDSRDVKKIVVNSPADAYAAWKSRGFTGRTVVYVSGTWERLDINVEPPASRPYPLRLYRLADMWERGELNSANFLYVAALNNIVRKIVVILPQDEFRLVGERARATKDFGIAGDELYFPYQGFPRWFTTGAGFKGEKEPVLLYVSAAYFRSGNPEELFRQLSGAVLTTDCVVLCTESGDSRVTDKERGDLMTFARIAGLSD